MFDEHRARFAELHARRHLFVMPNAWDIGSARLLAAQGFEALATTSQGHAWSLGKLDQQVTRDELVAHVEQIASATPLPLNVDSEQCFPDDEGGVRETVRLLGAAGAAGCSVEDYDPAAARIEERDVAAARVAEVVVAARSFDPPVVVTARAENHIRAVDDFDDTLERLSAYRDAGADVLYAPGLVSVEQIERVVGLGLPVNVLAVPTAPDRTTLERVGVRRISTGSLLASAAYGALAAAAGEIRERGTWGYAGHKLDRADAENAFGS